jgi:hypothetical protein
VNVRTSLCRAQYWTAMKQRETSRTWSDEFWGYVAVCVQLYCRYFTVLHLVVAVLHYMFRPTWPSSGVLVVAVLHYMFRPTWPSSGVRQWNIYNKAARRRQHNLKTYWTIQCSRMLKYNIIDQMRFVRAMEGSWKVGCVCLQTAREELNVTNELIL